MIVDSHQHFWRLDRGDYNWLTPKLAPIHRDFGLADLGPILSHHNIDATVLVQARAQRVAYLASLGRQRTLNAHEIARLQASAKRITARSQTIAPPTLPSAVPSASPATAISGEQQLTVSATGYALGGTTATGMPVGWGVVAVDPSVIPLGTRMSIPGYGEGVAADTGSAVQGASIDLWFPTLAEAMAWGRRTVTITLH